MISLTGKRFLKYTKDLRKAFTFIELLIVIGIIAVLVGVSSPAFKRTFNALELNSFSKSLQAFFLYLHEQAIVERKIIYLNIDVENKKYWAQINGEKSILKSYRIPSKINIETKQKQIALYPDGSIDKVTVTLTGADNQVVNLTTKGIFAGVKIESPQ